MKIAVTYENGEVFQHFGRTLQFKVYDIKNGEATCDHHEHEHHEGHDCSHGRKCRE
ncbi:MAG: hypothetical protein K6E34_07175 [Lachnospiraceae bacterium]|nr:hypothetical protein [Lachnospiraceae bacterium]